MKLKVLGALSTCTALLAFGHLSAETVPPSFPPPPLSADEALTLARTYVRDQHIAIADHYIDSVQFERHLAGEAAKFWLVTWLDNRIANDVALKGGQIYVRVFLDGTVKVTYGE